jgi:hypothetical protein
MIQRVERATSKSTVINGDVIEMFGLQPPGMKRNGGPQHDLFRDSTGAARQQVWIAPALTESVDAASKLMSRDWRIRSLSDATETTRARCILEKPSTAVKTLGGTIMETVVGYGCNRATALLAATLRAKAHDRASPMPPSAEFAQESEAVVSPEMQTVA